MRAWMLIACVVGAMACGSDDAPAAPSGTSGQSGAGPGGSSGAGQGGEAGQGGAGGGAGGAGASGSSGQAGAAGQPPAPVRTVTTRSPFGDLSVASTNLVLDGDFEFSPSSSIVPAWLGITKNQSVPVDYDSGGACVSGIYCARASKSLTVANFAVSLPPGKMVEASIRMKPSTGKCKTGGRATLYITTDTGDDGTQLKAPADAPGADGWCTLSATIAVPASVRQASIYLNTSQAYAVFDQAILQEVTGSPLVITAPLTATERAEGRALERFRHRRPSRPALHPAPPPRL